jgi:hypothetical protein
MTSPQLAGGADGLLVSAVPVNEYGEENVVDGRKNGRFQFGCSAVWADSSLLCWAVWADSSLLQHKCPYMLHGASDLNQIYLFQGSGQ